MLKLNVEKHLGDPRKKEFFLDVSLEIENGITALLGASGAGKTTLLKLIAGILNPDKGLIQLGLQTYFDSHQKINLSIQQRRVGFVFQNYALFPHLTAEQNVAYGIRNRDKNLKQAFALELLALCQIEKLRKRFPHQLSGGEQQRVALARTLASEPQIVLLDEPLSAVDNATRAELLNEIKLAQSRADVPFIYVTHNETEAEQLGNRQIILRDGKVIFS